MQKIRVYYGSGWVGPGLQVSLGIFCLLGKSSKIARTDILEEYTVYILLVYTLLKVVNNYDLSVLSMSVIGFQIKSLDVGWVGLFWIF